MGTKILRVTFRDGTRMYGAYCTVVDKAYAEIAMCSDDNNPTDDDLAVLVCERGDDAMFSSAKEEIVQCEVLHYGNVSAFTAWVSTAMRVDNLGKIIGATHGQEYRGDVAELAHK